MRDIDFYYKSVLNSINNSVWNSVENSVENSILDSGYNSVAGVIYNPNRIRNSVGNPLTDHFREIINELNK